MNMTTFFMWAATITLGLLCLIWSIRGFLNLCVKAWLLALAICGIVLLVRS